MMKELSLEKMVNVQGGLSNKQCMLLGGLAIIGLFGYGGASIGVTAYSIGGGCFDKW